MRWHPGGEPGRLFHTHAVYTESTAVKLVLKMLAICPPLTAWVMFVVLHRIHNYRADRITQNVGTFLPEISDLRSFVRNFHAEWAAYIAETCVLFAGTTPEQVKNAVTFTNPALLHDHFAAGHKVLLVSAHTAHTDWVWQGVCLEFAGRDLAVIGARLPSGPIDAMAQKSRTRYGGRTVCSDAVGGQLLSAPQRPDLIFAVGDFKPKSEANPKRDLLPFLNHQSYMYSSLPKLGRLMGVHLVYLDMQRSALGRFQVTFAELSPPPAPGDLQQVQDAYISQVENSVRTKPHAWWFWPKLLPDRTEQNSIPDQSTDPDEKAQRKITWNIDA